MRWKWNNEKIMNRISDHGTRVEVRWQYLFCALHRNTSLLKRIYFGGVVCLCGWGIYFFFCSGVFCLFVLKLFLWFCFGFLLRMRKQKRLRSFKAVSLRRMLLANSFSDCMPGSNEVLQQGFFHCWQAGGLPFCYGHILTKSTTEVALRQGTSSMWYERYCFWYLQIAND